MKNFVLFKNNSSWLHSLLIGGIGTLILFIMSVIIFVINTIYTNEKANNVGAGEFSLEFQYDVIVFPVNFVTSLLEIVFSIYLCFNIPMWWISMKNSMGKRKKFNSIFVFVSMTIILLLSIDAMIRTFYSFSYIGEYLKINGEDGVRPIAAIDFKHDGIFGTTQESTNRKYGNFGFNSFFLLISSIGLTVLFFSFFFLQKKLFKSEHHENSKQDVKNHYRSLEKNRMEKEMSKKKQKDLSKKINRF